MSPSVQFQEHAEAAVARTKVALLRLRSTLIAQMGRMSRPRQCRVEALLLDLGLRHCKLTDACVAMKEADGSALPLKWRHFLACYDDYLAAVRDSKCELANEEYIDDMAAKVATGRDSASLGRPAPVWLSSAQHR